MKRIALLMVCIFLLPAIFAEASTKEKNVQLVKAAERGNLADVQDALNGGADVNAKDIFGWTALMRASYGGYTYGRYAEVVKLLLDKGADVNIIKTDEGTTALMAASSGGYAEVVKLLLDKGANVNIKTKEGITALMEASSGGYAEVVKLLLDKGADVNIKTDEGITALMEASSGGYSKKEIFGKAQTAASERGCIEVIKLLLAKGANINVKNSKGETALVIAKDKGKTEIVGMLERAGAKK
jgi:ankyrin repeat protein